MYTWTQITNVFRNHNVCACLKAVTGKYTFILFMQLLYTYIGCPIMFDDRQYRIVSLYQFRFFLLCLNTNYLQYSIANNTIFDVCFGVILKSKKIEIFSISVEALA